MNTKSLVKTAIVLLAVPFSLIGAFWFLYILGYNMSVAVWVGLIALAGLDAETGVVMLLYLDHAWEQFKAEGRMTSMRDLHDAVIAGAVGRVRPKVMTVCAIFFGLLPIMWSPVTQAGADVMKRIAAPMIGGVVTSAILELLIYPVIYVIWRRRELPEKTEERAPFLPPEIVPSRQMRSRMLSGLKWVALVIAVITIFYGGKSVWQRVSPAKISGAPFITQTVNDLTVNLVNREGGLRQGDNEVMMEFRDRNGQFVDVGNVSFNINMNMPSMQMQGGGPAERTGTAGQYRAKVKAGMAGDWNTKISYDGPRGKGQTSFSVNIKQ